MQLSNDQINSIKYIYGELKYFGPVFGVIWFVFVHVNKILKDFSDSISFVKDIKNNDLHHIQISLDTLHSGLKDQTGAIVTELKELRADIRAKN